MTVANTQHHHRLSRNKIAIETPKPSETPRLSIAERFMSSNYNNTESLTIVDKNTNNTPTTSRVNSLAGELDLINTYKPSQVHPLDQTNSIIQENPNLFISSPTNSVLFNRPWGSQDTLVQAKKPIYAQYIDLEKNTAVSVNDYVISAQETPDNVYDQVEKGSIKQTIKNPSLKTKTTQTKRQVIEEEDSGITIGCCVISCHHKRKYHCGQRGWVICIFLSLILIALTIYFLWPRIPLMRIEGASLTVPVKITETKQNVMVGNVAFESEWLVNITVDNRQNYIPTNLVKVQMIAKDAFTGLIIGKGVHNEDDYHVVLAPKSISTIQMPVRIDYQARDTTDTTFIDLTKACLSNNSTERHSLPLHFWITLHFFGLDWLGYKPTIIATPATGGFACP